MGDVLHHLCIAALPLVLSDPSFPTGRARGRGGWFRERSGSRGLLCLQAPSGTPFPAPRTLPEVQASHSAASPSWPSTALFSLHITTPSVFSLPVPPSQAYRVRFHR